MQKIYTFLFTVFFVITVITFYFIALTIWLLTVLFDKRLAVLHQFMQFWGVMYLKVVPSWSIKYINRNKADKHKVYIIVANHLSNLDILAGSGLFFHYKWISKAEVVKIPFIGWAMRLNKYITFKRGDKESAKKMFRDSEKTLANGSSIFMFPEGTRSVNGELGEFKPGAFILAKKMKIPILPVVIKGTNLALPKSSLMLGKKCKMSVEILDEIPYENFENMRLDEIAKTVRNVIEQKLKSYDS